MLAKKELVHARTCVYRTGYHIVFSTKYRRKVLSSGVVEWLKKEFADSAKKHGFEVAEVEIGKAQKTDQAGDHVHIFASGRPKISPSVMVKILKGASGRRLFLRFPGVKKQLWKGRLWNPSYYLETVGSLTKDAVLKYIESQPHK